MIEDDPNRDAHQESDDEDESDDASEDEAQEAENKLSVDPDWDCIELDKHETLNNGWKIELQRIEPEILDIPADADLVTIFRTLATEVTERGVQFTNLYAQQAKRQGWRQLDVVEYEAFIGALIYMGKQRLTRVDAWREEPWGNNLLRSLFSARRFNDIMACLHFVDNTTVNVAARRKDTFWQVRPLIDALNNRFARHYSPANELGIDEMTTLFKGRSRAKQFNPNKPIKWGFKTFALGESKTGYILSFFPYQGKDTERGEESIAQFSISKLLQAPRFHNQNYIVAFDNWFANMVSVGWLIERGIHCVFTFRSSRKNFPSKQNLAVDKKNPGTYLISYLFTEQHLQPE